MAAEVERSQPRSSTRRGLRRLFSNVSAHDISRALVRRQGLSPMDTTRVSVLGHGQDTRIQNSTVNTTVHYHYTLRSPRESHDSKDIPREDNAQITNSDTPAESPSSTTTENKNDNTQGSPLVQAAAPRDAREVYVDIMVTKNRGFPLWIPSPNTSLPPEYRHSGVSIGDVGVLTPEGGFDFIFNIFANADDPINANSGLPDGFLPLSPPLRHHEVQRFKENTSGTQVADDSFERTEELDKITFTTSASEAAVLMMPEDVYVVKIQHQKRLRAYINAHIATWYVFVRQTLGRDINNGDLRVVYGYRKSTAFGIAAISTAKNPTKTRLTFRQNEDWVDQSGYKYRWNLSGSADVKTGPEYRESAELMYPVYGSSRMLPENQCLFISTIDPKLGREAWKQMELLSVPCFDTLHSESSPSPLQHESHLSLGRNNSTSGESPSTAPSTGSHARGVSVNTSSEPIFHPSNILNDVLLETNPEAHIAVVCNDDWEDYMQYTEPLDFISTILCRGRVIIENNVVFLEQQLSLSQTPKSESLISMARAEPESVARGPPDPSDGLSEEGDIKVPVENHPMSAVRNAFHRITPTQFSVKAIPAGDALLRQHRPSLRRTLSDPLAAALLPPPDETPTDRDERLKREYEAKKVGDLIDDMILQERNDMKKHKPEVTVLLLGQSEAGKSTTLKQFQLLHSPTAFSLERISWREVIYLNVLRSIRRILDAIAPDNGPLDDNDDDGYSPETASSIIPASGRSASALPDPHVNKYDHYRQRLEPLADLEEKLFQMLSSPDEDGPTKLGPSRPHWEHYANFYKNESMLQSALQSSPRPTIVIPQHSQQDSRDLPMNYMSSTGKFPPPPGKAKEIVIHTSRNWKKPFALGKSKSPKGPHMGEIEGWWEDPEDPVHVLNACAPTMLELWRDPQVRKVLQKKRLRLEETSGFYLEEIPRITAKKYIPTDADILKARLKTMGVVEHTFCIPSGSNRGVEWRIYDVGGSQNQRAAWTPYFEDVNAIIFLAPLSVFDQVLAEDGKVNRLEDSLNLWQTVVSNKLLANVSIVLFLNKCDLLQAKLQAGVRLNHYMVTYGDRPNDYNSIVKYFKHKFAVIHETYTPNKDRYLIIRLTAVTDTSRTSKIISYVRDIIIKGNLRNMKLV